ncbi:hypothetical protein L2E82_18060 [Cichorium intybus]|uniref:Uncharacterized protein n=1 Tax=Cichorium intybus TaxID=13427 RepID=A0ACB9FA47_CICIN|nr:hypothetical protein L2E82_18060 [Cichorium intybus]
MDTNHGVCGFEFHLRSVTVGCVGLDEYALLPPAYREHSHGKRQSVGLSFFSMKISKAMISSGNLLASTPVSNQLKESQKRKLFGELQVELTREKAYIGAAIGFVYGIISWELSQGIQNIPESSFQYANENALLIAHKLQRIKDQSEPKVKRISIAVFVGSSQGNLK